MTEGELLRQLIEVVTRQSTIYSQIYEGTVECQSGNSIDVSFPSSSSEDGSEGALPSLVSVPIYVGTPGIRAEIEPGTKVLVGFIGGDPRRPYALGFETGVKAKSINVETTKNIDLKADAKVLVDGTSINLGGDSAVLGAARINDPILAGTYAGTITGPCSTKVKIG